MKLNPALWNVCCPRCGTRNKVFVYDRGLKFWKRFFVGNNRIACRKCKIAWRRKNRERYVDLTTKSKNADHPKVRKRGLWWVRGMFSGFSSEIKKHFWTYVVVVVLCTLFAYFTIGSFSLSYQKRAPRQTSKIHKPGNGGGLAR